MNDEDQPIERKERRDAIENRQRILATARRLFAEQGIDATSMNQIAQAADVGPGTLYRNFTHKGDLCMTLLGDDIEAFHVRIAALLDGPDAPELALARLDLLLIELLRMTQSHVNLLMGFQEVSTGMGYEIYQTPFYKEVYARITRLLHEAVEQGEVAPLDAEFTADVIIATATPPLFVLQQRYRGFSLEKIGAGIRHLFIDGLRNK